LTATWDALVGTPSEVRRRGGVIPSWVPLTAVGLALVMLCFSAAIRTRAALNEAKTRFETEAARVEQIRNGNAALQAELKRLAEDPAAIAEAAHQYGMIRPNEKMVMLR
jgi:cell division protein FtsB